MARLVKAWPALLSAALLLLAFTPYRLGLLVLIALVPWLASLRDADGKSAWKSGYLFGLVYGVGQFHWLGVLAHRWTGSWLLGLVPWLLASAAYAIYFGLSGVLVAKCWRQGRPWLIPFAWAAVEVFRSYIPVFAFPWGLIASPLWPYPALIGAAYFGGIYLVGFAVVASNLMLAQVVLSETRRRIAVSAAMALAPVFAGLARYFYPPAADPMAVSVIQPGVDMAFGDIQARPWRLGEQVRPLVDEAQARGSRLIVLPEGIVSSATDPPQPPFALPNQAAILFGGRRPAGEGPGGAVYQSAFGYERGRWQHVDKTRLVIFGEFVPGRNWIPFLTAFRLPGGDLTAGEKVGVVELSSTRIGPVLCFEGLFPDIAHRMGRQEARLLAVLSIDDWYMDTLAPDQLRAGSVWRAVETGLPLVRSATLGYTVAVDSRGRLLGELPLRRPGSLHVQVEVPRRPQTFAFFPLFPLTAVALAAALAIARAPRRGVRP